MTLLLIFSAIVNIGLSAVAVKYVRKATNLEKKLEHTAVCLERADENNRRMLEAIDEANRSI